MSKGARKGPGKRYRHYLKRMSHAVPSHNGLGVLFAFETHKDQILECECPPAAIPEIVAKLIGAGEQAARNSGQTKVDLSYAVHVDKYALGGSLKGESALMMHLFPAPNCPVGFHLTLELADKLLADLRDTIATIRQGLPIKH
jgi:hypothetical protein